ncbi:MAG TPA: farnesyl diphosphate synthase [Gammaproteobacteria bacterium]|nr:farnesyl diphosphate synthase [Gammaproteobacteria bacterium]
MIARASGGTFGERITRYRDRVNLRLEHILSMGESVPRRLCEAMRYSVLGSGKRVRPLLVYASGELCRVEEAALDALAAGVELVHAYSLIHDDLPAMDDDDLRRGRPTTHRAFDEATAILTGDALQALAFEVLCRDEALAKQPTQQVKAMARLAQAAGPAGMVGGQALDLEAEGRSIDEQALENIHRRKTGELICAAIMMPSELGALGSNEREMLYRFASDIGLVFQIRDDLLEVEQDTQTLGKSAGSDTANEKSTYPAILSIDGARRKADEVYARALGALEIFGERGEGLRWLSEFILKRAY